MTQSWHYDVARKSSQFIQYLWPTGVRGLRQVVLAFQRIPITIEGQRILAIVDTGAKGTIINAAAARALGSESARGGIEVFSLVDQIRARTEHDSSWVLPSVHRKRLHGLAHDERRDRTEPQALADGSVEVVQSR